MGVAIFTDRAAECITEMVVRRLTAIIAQHAEPTITTGLWLVIDGPIPTPITEEPMYL